MFAATSVGSGLFALNPRGTTTAMLRPPDYFTSLAPHLRLFATGLPVLTYHKIGVRPWRARLKGLYLSPRLFDRQMRELRDAGFRSATLDEAARPEGNPGRGIVITFDDGWRSVFDNALQPLAAHGFRAIHYLVVNTIGRTNEWNRPSREAEEPMMDAHQVRDWLAAGHDIGSHTLTHPFLSRISQDEARREIVESRKKLEDLFGRPIRHFCYPYGDFNPVVRELVEGAGYQTACTTNFGVTTAASDRLALERIMARHRTRNLRQIVDRLRA